MLKRNGASSSLKLLRSLNRWSDVEIGDVVAMAIQSHERRSSCKWALDLSVLHGGRLMIDHDLVMKKDGWISPSDPGSAEAMQTTRILGASFILKDETRWFFPMPNVHRMEWNSHFSQLSAEMQMPTKIRPLKVESVPQANVAPDIVIETEDDEALEAASSVSSDDGDPTSPGYESEGLPF